MLALRVRTLPAGVVPVVVGSSLAVHAGGFRPGLALACVVVAVAVQVATNLVNDFADCVRGADIDRIGPLRVVQAGLLTRREVELGAVIALSVAALGGIPIVVVGGWPFLLLGIAALASAVLYTAGPAPLGYVGLGDAFVFAFFGVVATAGTFAVQTGSLSVDALVYGSAVGLLAVALLAVNNLRDIDRDRAAGKRTLAVRIGCTATKVQITACLAGAALLVVVPVVAGTAPLATLMSIGAALLWPAVLGPVWHARPQHPEHLIPVLGRVACVQVVFGILLSVGLLL